jgi:serine/threonine-protein kinase
MRRETSELLGRQIGHIRVIDVLGEGGMGAVYVGLDDTLHRRVAVKAIRSEFRLSAEARARFLREARILSQLNHPSVCTIHDYLEGEGNDFLVMELVEGRSLREVFKEELTKAGKLDIARQLLEVLAVVHGQGVIHRDLKPENVMVTPDGAIKILDFGLSRSADEEHAVSTVETLAPAEQPPRKGSAPPVRESTYVKTRLGLVLGTAAYMSPEQARGETATAASDMYSVGLVLQEMFAGEPPRDRQLEPVELLRRAGLGETRPVSGVAGDLADLLNRMKSLAPGSRPSALDAAAALQQITDAPKRRARRLATVLAMTALAVIAVVMSFMAIRIDREVERANQEAETAREVSHFLETLFEVSDPGTSRGETITAREILDQGARRVRWELADQPMVQARLMGTMGNVYLGLGLYEDSRALLEEALEIRQERLGEGHLDVVDAMRDLAWVVVESGSFEEARPQLEEVLAVRESQLGPEDPRVADSLSDLAILLGRMGEYEAADSHFERALSIREASLGPDHLETARLLTNMSTLAVDVGEYAEAKAHLERALRIRTTALDPGHPDVAKTLHNVALVESYLGDLEASRRLNERALEIFERVYGPTHPKVADSLNSLADTLQLLGAYEAAAPLFQRALEIYEAAYGPDHPAVARALGNLGMVLAQQEMYERARALLERALAIRERTLGPAHGYVGTTLGNLSRIVERLGDLGEAVRLRERSVTIYEQALGPDNPAVADGLSHLAELRAKTGDLGAALSLHERALRIRTASFGPEHPNVARCQVGLASVHAEMGHSARARALFDAGLDKLERSLGASHPRFLQVLEDYIELQRRLGEQAEAQRLEDRAAAIREELEREGGSG